MRRINVVSLTACGIVILTACQALAAQAALSVARLSAVERGSLTTEPASSANSLAAVIEKLLQAEREMRESFNHHSFEREVVIQTIGASGETNGQYIRRSKFILDDKGNRVEKVLFHPASTLQGIKISREDVQDLAGTQLIGWDLWDSSKHVFRYAGQQTVHGRMALAIDVLPAQTPDPHRMRERYFVGRLWLDADTYRIFLIQGRTEPQGKQRFPRFETRRAIVSGPHLFPIDTRADDVLTFPGRTVRIRVSVRFYNYRRFGSTVKITEVDEP